MAAAAVVAPGEWGRWAACAGPDLDPVVREVFTIDGWTPWDATAIMVCRGCPVRAACTAYAGSTNPVSGIWGGWRRAEHLPVHRPVQDLSVAPATITG